MSDLEISVNERLQTVESRMDATNIRVSKLEDLFKKSGAGNIYGGDTANVLNT